MRNLENMIYEMPTRWSLSRISQNYSNFFAMASFLECGRGRAPRKQMNFLQLMWWSFFSIRQTKPTSSMRFIFSSRQLVTTPLISPASCPPSSPILSNYPQRERSLERQSSQRVRRVRTSSWAKWRVAEKEGSKRAIAKRYMKRSSECGDLQSVNIMSSMILYLSVNLPASSKAIKSTLRFFIARIFTPYLRAILVYTILGREVKFRIIQPIRLAFTAFLTEPSSSLMMGKTVFSMMETADFQEILGRPSGSAFTYLTNQKYCSRFSACG